MKPLRAGLIGLGMMGRHHMRLLDQIDGVDFVGVHDPAISGQGEINGHHIFDSFDDLISNNIDYCVVAAPTIFHLEIGLKIGRAHV
jgi:predicted dehydrogenase